MWIILSVILLRLVPPMGQGRTRTVVFSLVYIRVFRRSTSARDSPSFLLQNDAVSLQGHQGSRNADASAMGQVP